MSFDSMTTNKKNDIQKNSSIGEYAIAEASGAQFWLEENRYYDFDRIDGEVDETITLDKVLLINNKKGLSIGKPYVKDAHIELKIMSHKRGKKIIVYKMRPKKKTRTKNGHRQELTRVMVTAISKDGKAKNATSSSKAKPKGSNVESKPSKIEKSSN